MFTGNLADAVVAQKNARVLYWGVKVRSVRVKWMFVDLANFTER